MILRRRQSEAFTLLELLIVISLIVVMASVVLPSATSTVRDQLNGAADIVAGEVAYARSLALAKNSSYKISLDSANDRLTLSHSGAAGSLDTLPSSPFRNPADAANQHVVALADLPRIGMPVHLAGALAKTVSGGSVTAISPATFLEFGPAGELTSGKETILWLTAGAGDSQRYLSIRVNPITGLTWIEDYRATRPSGLP